MPTSCVMAQQNQTFWSVATRGGAMTPNSNSGKLLYNASSHQVSSSYV